MNQFHLTVSLQPTGRKRLAADQDVIE